MVIQANSRLRVAVRGFHDEATNEVTTTSLVLPLSYRDTIDIDFLAKGFPQDIIHYASNSLHIGEKAIIDKALVALRNHYEFSERFHIKIHKTVPTGFGLGSGASNAWHIMQAIIKILKIKTTKAKLVEIAQTIGHDIAYFATNSPALFNGATQIATKVNLLIKPHILLLFPRKIVDKEKVTANFIRLPHEVNSNLLNLKKEKITKLADLTQYATNDFLNAALTDDDIKYLYADLQKQNVPLFGVAGRGTTIFVLSESRSIIRKLREHYRKLGFNAEITSIHIKEKKT